MIAPDLGPILLFTALILLACPILTGMFLYFRLRTKSKIQRVLISFLSIGLTFFCMLLLQRQFPYGMGIWFGLYFVFISVVTLLEYRKNDRKNTATDRGLNQDSFSDQTKK